jgi:hypothetical protein
MQVVRYYQYLKGELIGTDLRKEELLLKVVQRLAKQFGDPKVPNGAMVLRT